MGEEAAKIMIELLNSKNKSEVRQIVLPTKLIICQSSIKTI